MISISKILEIQKYVFPPSKANNRQLLDDHRIVHAWWISVVEKGKKLKDRKTGKRIDRDEIIKRHTKIVEEIFKRGYKHYYRSSLDDTLPKKFRDKTIQK